MNNRIIFVLDCITFSFCRFNHSLQRHWFSATNSEDADYA